MHFSPFLLLASSKPPTNSMSPGHSSSVVLYPSPGMGHLVSMFELGKLLVTGNNNLTVSILIVEPHYNTGAATAAFVASASASSNSSISFHRLPSLSPPPSPSPHHEALAFDLLRLSNPNLHRFLSSASPAPSALVIDFFCSCALDVSAQLNIPTYYFFTSGASCLSVFLHFPSIHETTSASFRELGTAKLEIPGVPPLPADHMPLPMLDRDDEAYKGFLYVARRLPEAKGIIINTVEAIEKRAVDAIAAGPFPRTYCIGPLINSHANGPSECLSWLDEQPRASVVFLCFGSLGLFSAAQLKDIAVGLERSGQRFLWVVRSPPSDDPADRFKAPPEPDLDRLLPEGFLNRTMERGMVVKSWAPQAAVLKHESVGAFVSHCGWNSVLEAVCGGVPMIGWPLYAEQRMNLVFLVEEMKLAVEMEGYDEEMVSAKEVERKVRWVMESVGGGELRERMTKAREAAVAAVEEGGSSHTALMELVEGLKRGG